MMMSIEKRRKIRIRDLNPHLTCMLCKGYFVNPVTITECIHTFCKSCLVRHISLVNKCPSCGIVIHETQPVYNIRSDRTMQDIINKILPRIEHDERKREKRFYKTKGLPYPASPLRAPFSNSSMLKEQKTKLLPTKSLANLSKPVVKAPSIGHLHHSTDQISLQLEYSSLEKTLDGLENGLQPLPKNFIRCSTHVTVGLLQRFVATKLQLESERIIAITHNEIEMDKEFTLKYISDNLLESMERLYPLKLKFKPIDLI
ncbi:polycomb group RING finger protein 3 isoform X2 [Exaiptasia diaphana]|uniref:RING-type domain-containing protein n=1 Tax=Exaiptasia diaphana TaxID=2652724 RepID=A0A913XSE2_EXADI|nr:polycomb group RING finger protein 3 isoform X2 [Exaiptasia diaphana]